MRRLLLLAAALAGLLVLADPATNRTLFLALNHAAMRLPDAFWSAATVLGDTLVALSLLLLLLRRQPRVVLAALLLALPATLITHGLKTGLDIARPLATLGDQVHVIGRPLVAGAFPSGHTLTAFVLATLVALRSPHAALAAYSLAALVGLSRIAVGAHWPLDVLGGALLGWALGRVGWAWVSRMDWSDRRSVQTAMRLFLLACVLVLYFGHDSGYPLARPFEQALALLILVWHLLPGWRLEKTS